VHAYLKNLVQSSAYFVVTAANASDESVPSYEANATPFRLDTTAPLVVGVVPHDHSLGVDQAAPIIVHCSEPLDATTLAAGFTVTSDAGPISGTRVQSGETVTFTPTQALGSSTLFTVRLTSALRDVAGNSLAPAITATFTTRPTAPSGGSAIAGRTAVTLSWAAVPEATGYAVFRSFTAGGPYLPIGGTTRTSLTDRAVVDGTTYYYAVTASTPAGESARSSDIVATPSASGLMPPGNVVAYVGNGAAELVWDSTSATSSYTIYRASSAAGPLTQVASVVVGVVFRDTSLSNGTRYRYVVEAHEPANVSAWSLETDAIREASRPATAVGLATSVGSAGSRWTGPRSRVPRATSSTRARTRKSAPRSPPGSTATAPSSSSRTRRPTRSP